MAMTQPITMAELEWNEQGLPVSRAYGDVYFSNEGGLDEARHVFLQGNHLAERMARADVFTIGETGFGSGLNFLALWQLWEQVAPPHARLRFFSAEKHPLRPEDMARIHGLFPQIGVYGTQLVQALPLPTPGYHRVHFAGGRVQLTLMYGDALEMLREQEAQADAWFLDGFAPRLNPDLWSAELAAELRRLSAGGATLATFSTSTSTQAALTDAGFALEKRPGFGRKKHMLTGHLSGQPAPYAPPAHVCVVGAGLAGAATAQALAMRGCKVQVLETASEPASGASGNPSAIFYPALTVGWQPQSQFYFMGFSHSLGLLRGSAGVAHDLCGMLLFPKPSEAPERQAKVLATMRPDSSVFHGVDAQQADALAGIDIGKAAIYLPSSGWVDLGQWTRQMLDHPLISTQYNAAATLPSQQLTVLCNGWAAESMHPALHGSMHRVGGQISCVADEPPVQGLRCVLSYGGYLTPAIDGLHHMGATYEKQVSHITPSDEGHARNQSKLADFLGQDAPPPQKGWAALRTVTRDRLPLLGRLDATAYANLAHASRGLLSCALGGEYIASQLFGDPLPLPRSIAGVLCARRFKALNE